MVIKLTNHENAPFRPPPLKFFERQRVPVHYDEAKKSQTDTKVTPSFVMKKNYLLKSLK